MCFFHSYITVRTTAGYTYRQCQHCGERLVIPVAGFSGHTPMDQAWLRTGHFTKQGKPPVKP